MRPAVMAIVSVFAVLQPMAAVASSAGSPASVAHVLVIVEENRSEESVIGASDAPYVNALASQHGLATESYGVSHPSLPNYLELISGSTQGVSDDGTGYSFGAPTLAGQLQAAGIGWRAYMEGMPSPCYGGAGGNGYAKKHDPFMYFTEVTRSAAMCASVVPLSGLPADLQNGTAPPFLWITPNLCHDGHDCSNATMDSWLAGTLPQVLASAWFAQDGIVIITWDEGYTGPGCCNGAHGGHIATIVVSSRLSHAATQSSPVDHAGLLRTIELLYGLPFLGDAECACSGDLMALVGPAPVPISGWLTAPHLR
ncbi:MAG: phosphoesterase [Candidatus Dormibacteraeota bacterium]|nr:phosphoesterase [Candidatus Dormibacteraeota bacterium]